MFVCLLSVYKLSSAKSLCACFERGVDLCDQVQLSAALTGY